MKSLLLVAALALGMGTPVDALAHGGGKNKCGCHVNKKTGECHCHPPKGNGTCGCSCQPASCNASGATKNAGERQ